MILKKFIEKLTFSSNNSSTNVHPSTSSSISTPIAQNLPNLPNQLSPRAIIRSQSTLHNPSYANNQRTEQNAPNRLENRSSSFNEFQRTSNNRSLENLNNRGLGHAEMGSKNSRSLNKNFSTSLNHEDECELYNDSSCHSQGSNLNNKVGIFIKFPIFVLTYFYSIN